jgi:hypothetical protein
MPPGVTKGLASQPVAQGLVRGGHGPADCVSRSVLTTPDDRHFCRANHRTPDISTG